MEGILIPIVGVLVGMAAFCVCVIVPRLRRFALAALLSPFITSVILLLGGFLLADMNPAREYGSAYVPTGEERDPTTWHRLLLLLCTAATFLSSAAVCFFAQRTAGEWFRRARHPMSPFDTGDREK